MGFLGAAAINRLIVSFMVSYLVRMFTVSKERDLGRNAVVVTLNAVLWGESYS